MSIFGDKEKLREVYKFTESDPSFEQFYNGLCKLSEGDSVSALSIFSTLILTPNGETIPYVLKYAFVAMCGNDPKLTELESMAELWNLQSIRCENQSEIVLSGSSLGLIRSAIKGNMSLESVLKEMGEKNGFKV
jgi:hypothetical protein